MTATFEIDFIGLALLFLLAFICAFILESTMLVSMSFLASMSPVPSACLELFIGR